MELSYKNSLNCQLIFYTLHNPNNPNEIRKSRYLLRVAVTRAMKKATILTPSKEKCPLF